MINDEFTNQTLMLDVGDGHKLHVIDWGNKNATTPFIFLHGGPGSGMKDKAKAQFNPAIQRVIFFDQRGCGESTPLGSLECNTIEDLANDITKIADYFNIDKFNLYGYSWGSTLALYYTIQYQDRIANTIIGGVFLGNNDFPNMLERAKIFFPEEYAKVFAATPPEYHEDPIKYHVDKALNGKPEEQKRSVYVIESLESALMNYDYDLVLPENYEEYDPAGGRIEIHYISNDCFMPKDYLVEHASEIKTPLYIVQGRADMVCPPAGAYAIAKAVSHAKLFWSTSNHQTEHDTSELLKAICELVSC